VLCSGTLVLNGAVLRQHLASKKHAKRAAAAQADAGAGPPLELHEVFCFAGDYASGSEEEMETWQERMDRLDKVVKDAKAKEDAAAVKLAAKQAAKKSKAKAKAKAAARPRPGKRQRQALREAGGEKPPAAKGSRKAKAPKHPAEGE
jgi:hypothetical protein